MTTLERSSVVCWVIGEGKGWAKGKKAATDPRVARMAAAHHGAIRGPYNVVAKRTRPLVWGPELAYAVGLLATDGCLINTGRHVAFDSCDEQLVRTFLTCIGRPLKYRAAPTRIGGVVYKALFGDVQLYRWLESIGLHQRKSLTLAAIAVPDEFFLPVVRGLLDGDGTISNFVHAPTRRRYPNYMYERLWTIFCSASLAHLEWIGDGLCRMLQINGRIARSKRREGRHDFYTLKYGKHASIELLTQLYADPSAPRLERKWMKWEDFRRRNLCAEGGS